MISSVVMCVTIFDSVKRRSRKQSLMNLFRGAEKIINNNSVFTFVTMIHNTMTTFQIKDTIITIFHPSKVYRGTGL